MPFLYALSGAGEKCRQTRNQRQFCRISCRRLWLPDERRRLHVGIDSRHKNSSIHRSK